MIAGIVLFFIRVFSRQLMRLQKANNWLSTEPFHIMLYIVKNQVLQVWLKLFGYLSSLNWMQIGNVMKMGAKEVLQQVTQIIAIPKVQPKYNQTTTEVQPNVNDNDNVNDNNKEILSVDNMKKDQLSSSVSLHSEEFIRFNKWLSENCPYVLKVSTQMTEEQYMKLVKEYSKQELCDALQSLNNWKDFPKKRTNVYRSTLDELKKRAGRSCYER